MKGNIIGNDMANIVIVYEHKAREMETVLLLQYELKKRNHDVSIFQINDLNRIRFLIKKIDLIITPFLYGNYELKYLFETFGHVNKICNLQWEQIYNGTCKDDYKRTPKDNAKYATHICWGENTYNRLIESGCSNAVLTGAPQMDFLKKRFSKWYLSRDELYSKYGIEKKNKTLLFISSFSYLGLSKERIERIKSLVDFDPYYFKNLTEKSRDIILLWFEKILKDNPKINIVYRPHPGELFDDRIEKLCNKYKNLYFISDGSVSQWIVGCDVILNWYSTAGVEAFFAGKNNVFLRPVDFPKNMDYQMFDMACQAKTYDDFISLISNEELVNEHYRKYPLKKNIAPYYLTDEALSFMKIVDIIEMLIREEEDNRIGSIYRSQWRLSGHFKWCIKLMLYRVCICSKFMLKIVKKRKRLKRFVEFYSKLDTEKINCEDKIAFEGRIKKVLLDYPKI